MAKLLADQGVNICLLSSDKRKVEMSQNKIKFKVEKDVKVESMVVDFKQLTDLKSYKKALQNKLHAYDFGILVLGQDDQTEEDENKDQDLECLRTLYIYKCMENKLIARDQRAAILIFGDALKDLR